MDTTKEYIKMCEKAVEIQELWEPKEGDCFYVLSGHYTNGAEHHNGETWNDEGSIVWAGDGSCPSNDYPDKKTRLEGNRYSNDDGKYIWLPRQDQLQKMAFQDTDYLVQAHAIVNFLDDCHVKYVNYHHKFKTWEQFWLAFVMKEKFNKVWTGDEWIKKEHLRI